MSKGLFVSLLLLFCTLVPMIAYWHILGGIPTVTPEDALYMLNKPEEGIILVDVRGQEEFEEIRVEGSIHWPLGEIEKISSVQEIPSKLEGKRLLLICNSGFLSARGTKKLHSLGMENVYNVRGGLSEWAKAGNRHSSMKFSRFSSRYGRDFYEVKEMSIFEQLSAVLAGFVVKPAYMILSLVLAWVLRQSRSRDLVSLRLGMLLFFLGEAFCAINYLFYNEDSYFAEYMHSLGMVASFGFTAFAFMEGIELRLMRFDSKENRCALLELCGRCFKYERVPCKARQLALLLILMLMILSFVPMLAPPSHASYSARILGTLYHYSNPILYQMFEARYCPVLSMLFFVASYIVLLKRPSQPLPSFSRIFLSAGFGALGFSVFRLFLRHVFEENLVWSVFWEEGTEMMFLVGVALFLWLFRRRLFEDASHDGDSITLKNLLF